MNDRGEFIGWRDWIAICITNALTTAPTPQQEESEGWQPIATAPDNLVWLFEPHEQGGFMFAGWRDPRGRWENNLDGRAHLPTHWMPLPSAPMEDGK